jgi:RNase P/RNase MRP subunit POP5
MRSVRRRYLLVQVESSETFDESEFIQGIWRMMYQLFGEYGASQTGLYKIVYDSSKRIAILRCHLNALNMVRAVITAITKINDKQVVLRVLALSGTLRALRKKLQ